MWDFTARSEAEEAEHIVEIQLLEEAPKTEDKDNPQYSNADFMWTLMNTLAWDEDKLKTQLHASYCEKGRYKTSG